MLTIGLVVGCSSSDAGSVHDIDIFRIIILWIGRATFKSDVSSVDVDESGAETE